MRAVVRCLHHAELPQVRESRVHGVQALDARLQLQGGLRPSAGLRVGRMTASELTETERKFLTSPYCSPWGFHISNVYHRPELWSLIKKGVIVLEDQSRPWRNQPSFYLVLTPTGQAIWDEINKRVEAGDHESYLP